MRASSDPGLRFAKPLQKPKPKLSALERRENLKVKARSGGRCEVVEHWLTFRATKSQPAVKLMMRCTRRATEIHHQLGGWRVRGRGKSVLAEHKQHVCRRCHEAITGTVGRKLVRVGGPEPHWTDTYRSV